MDLTGRSAVVAGGAGGLGGATTRHLVGLGVGVVILDPGAEKAAALAAELGARTSVVTGISNDDDTVHAAIAAAQELGTFSIAVSATGVVIRSPRLVDDEGNVMPKDVLQANFDLHVMGPFNLALRGRRLRRQRARRRRPARRDRADRAHQCVRRPGHDGAVRRREGCGGEHDAADGT